MSETLTLRDSASALTATFIPSAGMIGTSLAEDGTELLGQRRGLQAYLSDGKTMGIPILYPWANRLGANVYSVGTSTVDLAGVAGVRTDANGAPMHGVLAAHAGWRVTEQSSDAVTAQFEFTTPDLLAAFPFPHLLTQQITLADRTLTVTTTVSPQAEIAVPMCFGYHPYFTIADVPRADWTLTTPTMRRLAVDERGLPTGETEPWAAGSGVLGARALDDGFDLVAEGARFAISGGDRRIEVSFDRGYPAAQLFAPAGEDLVAIEPMAAPTDALRRGGYRVAAGIPATCQFSVRVS